MGWNSWNSRRPSCSGMTLAQRLVSWALETNSGRPIMTRLFLCERFSRSSNLSHMSLREVEIHASVAELALASSSKEEIRSSAWVSLWACAWSSMWSCSSRLCTAVSTVAARVGASGMPAERMRPSSSGITSEIDSSGSLKQAETGGHPEAWAGFVSWFCEECCRSWLCSPPPYVVPQTEVLTLVYFNMHFDLVSIRILANSTFASNFWGAIKQIIHIFRMHLKKQA